MPLNLEASLRSSLGSLCQAWLLSWVSYSSVSCVIWDHIRGQRTFLLMEVQSWISQQVLITSSAVDSVDMLSPQFHRMFSVLGKPWRRISVCWISSSRAAAFFAIPDRYFDKSVEWTGSGPGWSSLFSSAPASAVLLFLFSPLAFCSARVTFFFVSLISLF